MEFSAKDALSVAIEKKVNKWVGEKDIGLNMCVKLEIGRAHV